MAACQSAQIGYQLSHPIICCLQRPYQGTLEQCPRAGAQLAEEARRLAGK